MNRRLRVLRRASLVLLVAWLVALGASLVHRQLRRRPTIAEVEPTVATRAGDEQAVSVHRGFVYTDTVGIEPNFRVAAAETVELASGWYELRNVQVSIYHAGEVAYGLVSDTARYNPDRREAIATGNAQLSLSQGIALRAAGFTLRGAARTFASDGPVAFAGRGWGGLAGSVAGNMAADTLELRDNVSVTFRKEGEAAATVLLAPTLTYVRTRAAITFPAGLRLLQGRAELKAGSATMRLSGPTGRLELAQLENGVRLSGLLGDGAVVHGQAKSVELRVTPDDRVLMAATPDEGSGWVRLDWKAPEAGWRTLTAWRVVGEGTKAGGAEWIEGRGRACATEVLPSQAARFLSADALRVDFFGGKPASALAQGDVRLDESDRWATGDSLTASLRGNRFTLVPKLGGRVELGAPDLRALADRVESGDEGSIVAQGDVSGELTRNGLLGSDEGNVRFAAQRATATADATRLILDGEARLWQGERLLRADHLDYQSDTEVVSGQGNVLTLSPAPADKAGPGSLVRVSSRTMRYDRQANVVTYEGDVRLDDEKARIQTQRLTATLAPDGQILLATFEGGVTVQDDALGRSMSGQRARLFPGEDEFEIWGAPVLVKEPGGNQVKADHLVWHQAAGTLTVAGEDENPSETIYHPARATPTPRPGRRGP